jgi:hypothetical protein
MQRSRNIARVRPEPSFYCAGYSIISPDGDRLGDNRLCLVQAILSDQQLRELVAGVGILGKAPDRRAVNRFRLGTPIGPLGEEIGQLDTRLRVVRDTPDELPGYY